MLQNCNTLFSFFLKKFLILFEKQQTHTGPYENIKYAYDALCGWVAHHPEYKVCGPAIERYIKDEAMVHDPEELETGVLFPVCRAEE